MKRYILLALQLLAVLSCAKHAAPHIDEVWINMTEYPVGRVENAYPGQTLCLYGTGFTGLRHIEVNGTYIDVSKTLVYDTDRNITFQLPEDVKVSDRPENMYIRIFTEGGECEYSPFLIRPAELLPEITSVSSYILVPGTVLVISGKNLDGVKEVCLPAPYGGKTACEFADGQENDSRKIYVTVPADVSFATGQVEVILEKTDETCGFSFTERVYSDIYDFIN